MERPVKTIDLDCGIAFERIESWLNDELELPRSGQSRIFADQGETCSIRIEPLEQRTLGLVSIERTHLIAQGSPGAVESFEKLFTLRFISAGG